MTFISHVLVCNISKYSNITLKFNKKFNFKRYNFIFNKKTLKKNSDLTFYILNTIYLLWVLSLLSVFVLRLEYLVIDTFSFLAILVACLPISITYPPLKRMFPTLLPGTSLFFTFLIARLISFLQFCHIFSFLYLLILIIFSCT